ncbi:hypothetical protein ABZ471_30345 [Streptomyces sp. NPDC005728]|uniref:hypothetical protein n=1 Tax=Streptomyces sp. NPDC005728 TaxID=3157054 RepID=UPI00340F97E7
MFVAPAPGNGPSGELEDAVFADVDSGFSGEYRLLNKDSYRVDFPQFAHCAAQATVACTAPKP